MSAPDRSWTVAPTLAWFAVFAIAGIAYVDGDVTALADRLTHAREPAAAPSGPTFSAPLMKVADASRDEEVTTLLPVASAAGPDRTHGGVLEDACLDGTPEACKRWAMDAYYKGISDTKTGKLGRPVRASWYGDSVIATDTIPGRLRTKLQAELGDGGPGFIFVIEPHRFCSHEAVTRAHTGTWMTHAISTMPVGDGMYGAGGSSTEALGGSGATFNLNGAAKASRMELYYLAQPKGGTATVTADGAEIATANTAAEAKKAGGASAKIEGGARKFAIETRGKVRLFGIALENDRGAVVDNFGIVSVNVKNFARRDNANFSDELVHRGADLVMIQIGANEAHWLGPSDTAMTQYQGQYFAVLQTIRKALPEASCMVISPTDQAEAKDGAYPSRPVMPVLVAAQRAAATRAGCAFFATYDWMGGKGSAAKWFKTGLLGSDFTHLSRKGANKLSDAMYEALMSGYAKYAAH